MSALIDAMVGDEYTTGSGSSDSMSSYASGAFQAASALGLGYLSRRLDIDLSQRAAQTGTTSIKSNQTPIANSGAMASLASSPVLPLLAIGAAAVVIFLALKG